MNDTTTVGFLNATNVGLLNAMAREDVVLMEQGLMRVRDEGLMGAGSTAGLCWRRTSVGDATAMKGVVLVGRSSMNLEGVGLGSATTLVGFLNATTIGTGSTAGRCWRCLRRKSVVDDGLKGRVDGDLMGRMASRATTLEGVVLVEAVGLGGGPCRLAVASANAREVFDSGLMGILVVPIGIDLVLIGESQGG